MSGLCPFAGQAEYVSPAQCGVYDAQAQINRRSVAISSASHAEGRWFDPSRDHHEIAVQEWCFAIAAGWPTGKIDTRFRDDA